MAQSKRKAISDAQLLSACKRQASQGVGILDSKLARERQDITDAYNGKKPLPVREGGSKYISRDVYNAVEAMKGQLLETFAAGNNIVQFSPQNANDTAMARIASSYTDYQIFRLNDGLEIFGDVMHDGLTARVGVAKVYWEKSSEIEAEHAFEQMPEEHFIGVMQHPGFELQAKPKVTIGPDGSKLYTGFANQMVDTSQVRIDTIPPEEFIVASRTKDLRRASYCAHRALKTLGQLVEEGYDQDLVDSIGGDDDDLNVNMERTQRHEATEDGVLWGSDDAEDEAGREVTVYDSYLRIDLEGAGVQRLWRVVHASGVILHKEKVKSHPFCAFRPLPIPHTFYGTNYAQNVMPIANAKTVLTRSILELTVNAANPRWQVVKGGLTNPRELLDPRNGGIVNVKDRESILPMPQGQLPPQAFQVLQMTDSDREDITGISRLSQGLSKDAMSKQNSQGLVEQLTSNSQVRQKVVARHFAIQFLRELYLKVYELVIENEKSEKVFELAGEFVPVTPGQWTSRRHVTVDLKLGFGERDQVVEEYLTAHKIMGSDESMARMYGEQQKYNLMSTVFKLKDIKNFQDYLVDPTTLQPPAPDPKAQAELDALIKKTAREDKEVALREQQLAHQAQMETMQFEMNQKIEDIRLALAGRAEDRKDKETENRIDVAMAELEIATNVATQADPANEKVATIISPNS
ncbi:hypothetical protein EUV02_03915 [Polymorphobacter arshaanensis]|uniref:Portal protein n=1 Tax=Glacieibacterium arshaanense TaxID=2511025 RepID=A0A4Y9ER96_9SPHN|nr:portal protein [Polymorphobacter arshaanensis]TFU06167.1 hypothetical protein EUV02_03915 [Polymorphobacter arshaanensis]